MASTHIEIKGDTRLGAKLRAIVDQLTNLTSELEEAKSVYDQLAFGGDYAALGAALNCTAVEAETIYNLIGSVVSEQAAATFTNQLLSRVG